MPTISVEEVASINVSDANLLAYLISLANYLLFSV
jgi:hypothetical protein